MPAELKKSQRVQWVGSGMDRAASKQDLRGSTEIARNAVWSLRLISEGKAK